MKKDLIPNLCVEKRKNVLDLLVALANRKNLAKKGKFNFILKTFETEKKLLKADLHNVHQPQNSNATYKFSLSHKYPHNLCELLPKIRLKDLC